MKYKVLTIILTVFFSTSVFANPFTGNKNSPSPVRQGRPNTQIVESQRFLHQKLADYINEWSQNNSYKSFFIILFFSFLYGIIHAIGPGHRKTVIFSFYITRKAHILEPLWVSFVLAFSHGGIALLLAFIFKGVAGAMSVNTNDASIYLEGFSFILLIFLSFFSILHVFFDHLGKHQHNNHASENLKLSALLLSGLYPCPAAILVLVLTFALNIITLGVLAILAMSLGMCIPITVSGYLAWLGRKSLFKKLKDKKLAGYINIALESSGYIFLFCFSLYTAMPFILSLIAKLKG
ncbi:MAG: HoxN/HupN/NixA family nickel/cobalt transporter [Treponema sp.]